jgi:hypothetical protein
MDQGLIANIFLTTSFLFFRYLSRRRTAKPSSKGIGLILGKLLNLLKLGCAVGDAKGNKGLNLKI